MNLKEGLLLLGVLIALLCIPAAVTAAGNSGGEGCPYINVTFDSPESYYGMTIKTVDALDPLDVRNTLVTLKSTEAGDLKAIEGPKFGGITRVFCPSEGNYHGAEVTVEDKKTIDGKTIPCHQYVYVTPMIPSFTVNVPGQCGNVLLIKCPESIDGDASFTEIFNAAEKEGYLFTNYGVYYSIGNSRGYYGDQDKRKDNENDLNFTLNENLVDLECFSFNAGNLESIPKPDAGEYLLTAVKYDSDCDTMHVLAAMPVLILEKDTPVIWSGDKPYYQNQKKDVTICFGKDVEVDKIAYALVKTDTRYGLEVEVNTEELAKELAKQSIPTSPVGAIPILKGIAEEGIPAEYTLTCCGDEKGVTYNTDSRLAIVEGYGCSGANDADEVTIAAATLKKLNPGTYYLYALGMNEQSVTAIDQKEIVIKATKSSSGGSGGGGGGGGGGGSTTETPISYDERGSLMTDSNGIVTHSVVISATDEVASLFVPSGVKALDADGNPLSEIFINRIGSDKMPAVPAGAVYKFAGYAYEAGPNGATFEPGITLSLEIPEDDWNALDLDDCKLAVKWYNKETEQWEDVPTKVFQSAMSVDAEITHFSTYALFTEPVTTTTPIDTETPTTPTTPAEEPPAEDGVSMTMILFIIIIIAIIAAAGYFFMTKK